MPASKYAPALGTTLAITPSGGTLTAITQLLKITPPSAKREQIETTNLGSADTEFLLSIPDSGEMELEIEWDSTNAGHAALWTNFTLANPVTAMAATWTITFNDKVSTTGTVVTFSGGISAWKWGDLDVKKVATVSLTVRITGAITITPAT